MDMEHDHETAAGDLLFQRLMAEQEREIAADADRLAEWGVEKARKALEAAFQRDEQDTRDWHEAGMGEAVERKDLAMIELKKAEAQVTEAEAQVTEADAQMAKAEARYDALRRARAAAAMNESVS